MLIRKREPIFDERYSDNRQLFTWRVVDILSYSLTPRLVSLENRVGEIPMLLNNFLGPCL